MDAELRGEINRSNLWITLGEWALILAAVGFFTVTEAYQPFVTVGLGLLAVFFAERGIRGKLIATKSGLELPLLLFLVSAAAATWISYNQEAALLQFARILGAAAFFFALKDSKSPLPEIVGFGFLAAAAFLAVYWPLKNDFLQFPGKLEWITTVGSKLNAWFPTPPGPEIHSNVAAGTLLVSLPVGAALCWVLWKGGLRKIGLAASALTLIVLFGLAMTSSRGAWVGLLGLIVLTALTLIQRRIFQDKRSKALFWLGVLLLGLLSLFVIVASGGLDMLVGQIPDPSGSLRSRQALWREGIYLARDYFFTGSGLQTHWMVHAVYGLLIHVPYIAHAHNSFLEVWIEQGLVGALALIWGILITARWAWKGLDRRDIPVLGWAGLAALIAAAIHGVVDVVFYIERTLPVMGLILGFSVLSSSGEEKQASVLRPHRRLSLTLPISVLLLGLIGLLTRQQIAATWLANIGAIEQTKLELSAYDLDNYLELNLDQVRQDSTLDNAQRYFLEALKFDHNNPTALQRLSMIALGRSDYKQALTWMEHAWNSGNREPVTRLLYGDALVADGQSEEAAEVISGLGWAENRLLLDAWLRYWNHQDYARAASAWETVLILDPSNTAVRDQLSEALSKIEP